jgi:hypothetical protein
MEAEEVVVSSADAASAGRSEGQSKAKLYFFRICNTIGISRTFRRKFAYIAYSCTWGRRDEL